MGVMGVLREVRKAPRGRGVGDAEGTPRGRIRGRERRAL